MVIDIEGVNWGSGLTRLSVLNPKILVHLTKTSTTLGMLKHVRFELGRCWHTQLMLHLVYHFVGVNFALGVLFVNLEKSRALFLNLLGLFIHFNKI
jgi:hypothetical protein